jgi:hypothetical protein
MGDIVYVDEYRYYLCTEHHTSGVVFADPPWAQVFDATAAVDTVNTAASEAAQDAADAEAAADIAQAAADEATSIQSSFKWTYDDNTASSDPLAGNIKFNSHDPNLITRVYISSFSGDPGNPNVSPWTLSWDDSTNTTSKGSLYLRREDSPANFMVLTVNGPVVDNGPWQEVPVTQITHGGSLADGDDILVAFMRTGDAGISGTGGGDMVSTENLNDVENKATSRTNLGVGDTSTPTFNQILLTAPPASATHAATKEYVDAIAVPPATVAPLMDGVAAIGTTTKYAREDHKHPTDTSRAASSHSHPTSDITGLDTALSGKAPTTHTHAQADVTNLTTDLALKAPLASPTFTGTPTANATPPLNNNSFRLATTEYVDRGLNAGSKIIVSDAPPGSPSPGTLWWESDKGMMYLYYNDGNTSQWVPAVPVPDTSTLVTKAEATPFDAMAANGMQINGSMEISQELNGATRGTPGYIGDCWFTSYSGSMTLSAAVTNSVVFAEKGFTHCAFVSVASALGTPTGSDYLFVAQSLEGYRVSKLRFGTTAPMSFTISFWSAHNRPGLYSVAVRNAARDRVYVTTYTHAVADTPQYNTLTIPGISTGAWNKTNLEGLNVIFTAMCGPTYTAPSINTWLTGNYMAASGQVNGVGATSDVFRITGVTFLPGIQAPTAAQSPLLARPYDEELLMCERYYQFVAAAADFEASGASIAIEPLTFAPTMRSMPTCTYSTTGAANNMGSITLTPVSARHGTCTFTASGAGRAYHYGKILCDARL